MCYCLKLFRGGFCVACQCWCMLPILVSKGFFFGFILSGLMNEVKIMLHVSRYHTDPSGTFWQCNAKAIGSGSEGADTALQEHYEPNMTLEEAETLALSTLKQVMEEKVVETTFQLIVVNSLTCVFSLLFLFLVFFLFGN
jgi:20S proteasome alpha/beta subunit